MVNHPLILSSIDQFRISKFFKSWLLYSDHEWKERHFFSLLIIMTIMIKNISLYLVQVSAVTGTHGTTNLNSLDCLELVWFFTFKVMFVLSDVLLQDIFAHHQLSNSVVFLDQHGVDWTLNERDKYKNHKFL